MEPQVDKQAHLDHKFLMRIILINDTLAMLPTTLESKIKERGKAYSNLAPKH